MSGWSKFAINSDSKIRLKIYILFLRIGVKINQLSGNIRQGIERYSVFYSLFTLHRSLITEYRLPSSAPIQP